MQTFASIKAARCLSIRAARIAPVAATVFTTISFAATLAGSDFLMYLSGSAALAALYAWDRSADSSTKGGDR